MSKLTSRSHKSAAADSSSLSAFGRRKPAEGASECEPEGQQFAPANRRHALQGALAGKPDLAMDGVRIHVAEAA